jgi:polysaccharide biosynthesis protein PslH
MIRASRPDILCLAHRVPYPPDKGDRIRTYHLLKWVAARAAVHLACLADEPVDDGTRAALSHLCERVEVVRLGPRSRWLRALGSLARGHTITEGAFDSPPLRAVLRRWARGTQFHAALASASSLIPYLRLEELRGVPVVVDLVDVDSQKWLDYAAAGRGLRAQLYRTEGRRLRQLEQGLPSWARAVTLVSEAEAALYRQTCGEGLVHVISNGVALDYFRPVPPLPERGCVFVGALDYRPNVDGAVWFCREVWPGVRRRHPQAVLRLVGRRPAPAVRRLAEQPGVELVGQVPDVRPHLAGAAVAVVPLRIARGVQNKILEALAMGKATVASPQSLAGLRAGPGVHLLSASTPEEWVGAVTRLLDDEGLRQRLSSAGRRYVEENHHWDRCLEPLGTILELPMETGWEGKSLTERDETAAGPVCAARGGGTG